jgi:hypothetical protein
VEQVDLTDAIVAKIIVDQRTREVIKQVREECKQR